MNALTSIEISSNGNRKHETNKIKKQNNENSMNKFNNLNKMKKNETQ